MEGSSTPRSNFRLKLESFSSLSTSLRRLEFCEFTAGDRKWKLVIYPKGNTENGGKDHISIYLVLADNCSLHHDEEMIVSFSLFVYDNILDKYLSVQGISRFSPTKCQSGFDKFLSLKVFSDPSNGYLVDDTCMFGAEVFFVESTIKNTVERVPFKYIWKVEKFSKLEHQPYISETFTTGGYDFNLRLYSEGNGDQKGKSLSLFLGFADFEELAPDIEVPVEFSCRVVDQKNKQHKDAATDVCLGKTRQTWGWSALLPLGDLNGSTGYLVDDTCVLQLRECVEQMIAVNAEQRFSSLLD